MHPFNLFKRKPIAQSLSLVDLAGWHGLDSYEHFKDNQYENAFPSITKIADQVAVTMPYAKDETGKRVASNIITRLEHPNQGMSGAEFREALAVMTLVHPEVYVLAWHREGVTSFPGGKITSNNLSGFTFLEGVVKMVQDGTVTYQYCGSQYTPKEVIELKGINPYNLSKGFSASQSAKRWTNLDDYLADYQTGFFKNGAVPAGMFLIVAPTPKEYEDIKDKMQAAQRGAKNNNNVMYSHTPIDPTTGKPTTVSQITWIPFNVGNKDLSLKDLFNQINKKIDSSYGVPASIRGVNDSNTYASVQADEIIFTKYVVYPFIMKLWDRFSHELNRITGGTGIVITFDYEFPQVAEEQLTISQKQTADLANIATLKSQGYTLKQAVLALKLPDSYLLLEEATVDDDNVDNGGDTKASPDTEDGTGNKQARQIAQSGKDPDGIYSEKGRFLAKKLGNGKLLIKSPDKHDVVVEL